MSDIFISYKREDQLVARRLADALEKQGWGVWWDPKLRAGEHFDSTIEAALNEAKCVVVLWCKIAVKSPYVCDEARYGLEKSKLVPVALEDVELPFRFSGIHTPKLLNWDDLDDSAEFRKLVEDISVLISRGVEGKKLLGRTEPEVISEQGSLLQLIYRESEWPFELNKPDNSNIKTIRIGLKNIAGNMLSNCYVRIEQIKSENPASLFNIFDKSKLTTPPAQRQIVSIGAEDIEYIPIAQLDRINFDLAGLGIELLCHSIEGHTNLDPAQSHTITMKASAEKGRPVEAKYRLWVEHRNNLRLQIIE